LSPTSVVLVAGYRWTQGMINIMVGERLTGTAELLDVDRCGAWGGQMCCRDGRFLDRAAERAGGWSRPADVVASSVV